MKHIKKICKTCKVEKSLDSFSFRKDTQNYRGQCKTCRNKVKYQAEKIRRKNKTLNSNIYYSDVCSGARQRAKKNGIEFTLKVADIKNCMTDRCPILNIKFELNKPNLKWGNKKGQNNWTTSPSIDRIDNTKGYHADNIIVVCWLVNAIKNQATPDQIIQVGEFYKKLYEEKGIKSE